KAGTHRQLLVKFRKAELRASPHYIGCNSVTSLIRESPHVTGIDEYGTTDKAEKLLAKFGTSFKKYLCRLFDAVIKQAILVGIFAHFRLCRSRAQTSWSPGPNAVTSAYEEELFIGQAFVV